MLMLLSSCVLLGISPASLLCCASSHLILLCQVGPSFFSLSLHTPAPASPTLLGKSVLAPAAAASAGSRNLTLIPQRKGWEAPDPLAKEPRGFSVAAQGGQQHRPGPFSCSKRVVTYPGMQGSWDSAAGRLAADNTTQAAATASKEGGMLMLVAGTHLQGNKPTPG